MSSIRIFTDSQRALKLIQKSSIEGLDILLKIRNITVDLLKAEKPLILHQILGYKNVPRNELADQAVKEAAQYTSRVNLISLLYTKKRIQKKYKLKPLNPLILRGKRSLVARYLQLKLGYAIVGTHLQRIKAEELAKCQQYKERQQSPKHLLFSYRKWKGPRKSLLKALEMSQAYL